MPVNRGNRNGREVDTTGKHDEVKGNIFDNLKRQSRSNIVNVECVDNNDMDMEDSQTIMVDDTVMKWCDSVMNSVNFDHKYSIRNGATNGIVSIPTVQHIGDVVLEETVSNNKEDIVSELFIDGEIVDEIKKINDKLQCNKNIDSEVGSDMEENGCIKTSLKKKSLVYNVSRPKDVLISSAIVDYGSTSYEETSIIISRQELKTKVHSMEEFRLRNCCITLMCTNHVSQ